MTRLMIHDISAQRRNPVKCRDMRLLPNVQSSGTRG
jgi:hypothetical protein